MAKTIARWTALAALFLIPLIPLVVVNSFFFPFITGKAFLFRILIEILVCAWAVLALLDREYRPRLSYIGIAAIAFVAWMFLADALALNAAKAFWSNFERMEGWVLLIHLLGFFFAASAILRVEKRWRAWLLASLGVSMLVVAYAFFQLVGVLAIHQGASRIDATFGNSAYLAIYFLFNTCIAAYLALTERRAWLKGALLALAVVEAVLIFFTETRGTILGLVAALALAALLAALTAGKRVRSYAVAGLALILLLAGGFYLARDSAFVQGNHVLQRIATISLSDGQTRFTIWHMAFEGALERPITGWGQEGFNYVFNKYYDPSLYGQEPWFDRAHDVFVDWLVAGGVPAFVLYLALFGSAITLLWRRSELSRTERIALTAAFAGYAVHNLFVFDNLYSYIYFFALLAFIDAQVARPIDRLEALPVVGADDGLVYALPAAAAVALVLIWTVNVPGMTVASELITALSPSSAGMSGNIAAFTDLAAHPAFAAQEVREQIVSFAMSVIPESSATDQEKQQAATLAVTEMQKQVAAYPEDARERLQLAYVYRAVGDDADAIAEIEAASKLSPKKEQIWIELGATEWEAGNLKAAQADFATAYALGPQFKDLAAYAAAGDFAAGDAAVAEGILRTSYGTTTVDSDILAVAYYRTKDWPRLIGIWQLRAASPSATAQTWFGLAAAYYAAGDRASAIRTINAAVAKYPDAAASGAAAITQIQAGK
jgi:O-antigen ligase/thioredoxin-like negative regulator of GroEL